jgi:hypothetical protein
MSRPGVLVDSSRLTFSCFLLLQNVLIDNTGGFVAIYVVVLACWPKRMQTPNQLLSSFTLSSSLTTATNYRVLVSGA